MSKMKKIQIAGTGCPKCTKLFDQAEAAAQELGIVFEIEKVTDINRIIEMGVVITPALLVDGTIKAAGKSLSKDAIKVFLL